jgi:hypothetical protein
MTILTAIVYLLLIAVDKEDDKGETFSAMALFSMWFDFFLIIYYLKLTLS